MKRNAILVALAFAVSLPAFASESTTISDLSRETGLSQRHVRMIVGNRTPYAESSYAYDRQFKRFSQALGSERTKRLLSGERVELASGRIVMLDRAAPPAG